MLNKILITFVFGILFTSSYSWSNVVTTNGITITPTDDYGWATISAKGGATCGDFAVSVANWGGTGTFTIAASSSITTVNNSHATLTSTGITGGNATFTVSRASNISFDVYFTFSSGTLYVSSTACTVLGATLTASALTSFGSACTSTTVGPNSFTISGASLTTADVTVASLSGYTFSTTSGGTYTNSLTLTQGGGAYSQAIYVKFSPVAVQSYNGNIVVGGGGATSVNVAAVGSGVSSTVPIITTPTAVVTGTSTATLGGNITVAGCSQNVTERGIYWSTTNGFADGAGTKVSETGTYSAGVFTLSVTGLSTSTTIYYKVFATNATGTTYTTQSSFSNTPLDFYQRQTGNWSDPNSWQNSSGWGTQTAATSAPSIIDNVHFYNNGNNATITLTADATCANLDFANSGTGTLAQGNFNLTASGNLSCDGSSTFTQGTGYLILTGASKTISGGAARTIANLRISSNTISYSNTNTLTISGSLDINNSTAFSQSNGTIALTGTITNSLSCAITVSSGTLNLSGTSSASLSFAGITQSGGTINFGAKDVTNSGDFTYSSGTYTHTGILTMSGASKTLNITSNITISKLTLGSSTISKSGANQLTISSIFDMNNQTAFTQSAGTIDLTGTASNYSLMAMAYSGTPTFKYSGGGNMVGGSYYTLTVQTTDITIPCGTTVATVGTFTNSRAITGPTSAGQYARFVNTSAIANSGNIGASTSNIACSSTITGGTVGANVLQSSAQVAVCIVPTITVSQTTRTGFSYYTGNGPSAEQSFTVSGVYLTNNITITPPTDYEISTGTGGSFVATNPITLTQSGGNVAVTTIYVRLKSGLAVAAYNTENIVHTSAGATTKNVACSGDVLPIPTVTLASSSPAVAAANIAAGTTNNVVYAFTLTTTSATATLNQIVFANTGTAVYTTDITNYKLYYTSTSSTFATGTCLGTITSGTTFTGLTQALAVGGPYYFWITSDIVSAPTANRTIIISALANAGITYSSGVVTKAGSASAGGTQTIVYPTIVMSSASQVGIANIGQNTNSNIVSYFQMAITNANAALNSIQITTTGSYVNADVSAIKLWYGTGAFGAATQLGSSITGTTLPGTYSFSALGATLNTGSTYNFWITADVTTTAVATHTLTVSAIANANVAFTSSSKSGSATAAGQQTIIATTPVVTLGDNTQVTASSLTKNTTNNVIAKFKLDVSSANTATVNTVQFTTTGTAVTTTDITNFKLWYASTNAFGSASQIGSSITTTLGAGAHSFTGLTQSITFSTSGYFWITTDIPAGATTGNTITVSAMATTDITLASGSKSGSTTAAGLQTISSVITLYSIAGGGNWNDNTKWSTTAGGASCTCYPQAGTHNAVITSGNPITVNAASGCVDLTVNASATLTGSTNTLAVSGNFSNSGTYTPSSNTTTIGGNYTTSGTVNSSSGTMTITGNLTNSGSYTASSGTTSVAGNFTSTSGTFTNNNGTVSMSGTTAQSISVSGNLNNFTNSNTSATVTAGSSITINNTFTTSAGAVLDMSTYQLLGSLNTITNNGTLKTSCTSNPPIPSSKTWGGTVQYANTSGYVSQGTYNNLSMLNASGAPQLTGANLTVNGTLLTTAGGTLDLVGYTLGGTLGTITNNGTIKSTNNNPFPTGKTWGGTIEYAATGGGQTIASGTYNNLTNSNTSATNTANGNVVVDGTLITSAGGTFSLSTNTLSGTLGTITNNGTISTANTSATPFPSGKTWGGTVKNSGANITLVAGTYNNFTVDNGNVTVSGAVNIGGILSWANNGVITTSAGNTLTITNTAVGAVPAGTTSRYISGPLTRTIAANLTASANVYEFPVGKGGTYYPYSMTTLTTGASAPTITVEAFNANCGGSSDGTTAGSLSTTEYWSASFTGNYTTGSVSIGRQSAALSAIGRSATAAGVYASIGGTVSGNNINTSSLTGASLGYFAMCKVPYYSRTSGSWTTGATWSTSCGGAASSTYPGAGDIVTICGGNTVTLNDNVTVGTLTVTGSGSNLTMGDMWNETLTVTGNAYIEEGGTMTGAASNKWFYWVFNNLLIGSNSSTAATSSFNFVTTNTNSCGLTISGTLTVGSCNETSSALFNYSPILSGGTNTITIPNRTMYPNGTYTFGPTGGSAPAAPTTTVTTLTCPRITASSTTLNGMSYVVGSGPSIVRSFTVTGSDLVGSGNITVSSASTDYEVCSTSGGTYSSSFTIPFASGVITGQPISVYVRLKAGLSKGSYNSQTITLSGGTATRNITCNGMVTAVISAAKSTLTPTSNTIVADGASIQILTVQAYDTDGTAVSTPGLTVAITRQSGTGTIGSVTDNGNGTYTAVVTSPTTVGTGVFIATIGGSQVQSNTGSQTQATITYIAGPPTTLTIQAGNNQTATVSTSVPVDPRVVLTDANGNPVSGIDVTFTVTSGGGVVTNYVVVTNASGVATLGDWQLGATPGTNTISAVASSTVPIKAISYPFPQSLRQTYPFGITASSPDYGRIQNLVDQWKTSYYTEGTCGATPCARVKWDVASNTVSEGIAYGMLIFVYTENETNNYKDEFDKLWEYYDYHKDGKGLMDWKIDGFTGNRLGTGGATDADMDVALALIQADRQWGSSGAVNYIGEAETLLNSIYANEVDGNKLFKPGGNWNSVQNPSYAELFAIKLASDVQASEGFTLTNDWNSVYTAMQNYTTHYQDATTGLWPNWTDANATGNCNSGGYNATDDKCGGWYNQGCVYGVDALRTPWRVAWDYAWYGTASSKASTDKLAAWLGTGSIADNPANVGGLYNLDGTRYTACTRADTTNLLGFYGGLATSYMTNAAEQTNLDSWYQYVEDANVWHGEYYNPSLQILYLLTMSGNTPNFTSMDPLVAPPVEFAADAEAFLPITLINFKAIPKDNNVILNWTTASELNNDYFVLERSYDGNNWEAIYTCKGAGTTSINHSYSYIDNDISEHPSPYIYYKLKQVDFNGENSTSKIISVFNSTNTTSNIYVYPNPFDGRVLYLTGLKDNVEIELYNSAGAVIYRNKIFASTTVVIINLDNELPSGMYSIKCRTPNKTYLQHLIVK